MINKVILIGNVGSDPETKTFDGGNSVCNLTLATTEKYKDKSGEKKETTEWHRLELWGKLADIATQYVHKGDKIYVEGKLKTSSYEDKEGVTRYKTVISVSTLQMLGSKSSATTAVSTPQSTAFTETPDTDDLPF